MPHTCYKYYKMHFTLKIDKRWSSNILYNHHRTRAAPKPLNLVLRSKNFNLVQHPKPSAQVWHPSLSRIYVSDDASLLEFSKLLINMAVTTRLFQTLKRIYRDLFFLTNRVLDWNELSGVVHLIKQKVFKFSESSFGPYLISYFLLTFNLLKVHASNRKVWN